MTDIRTEPARARPNTPVLPLRRRAAEIARDTLQQQGVTELWTIDEHGSTVPTAEYAAACEAAEASLITEHGDPMVTAREQADRLLHAMRADCGGARHARRDLAVSELAGTQPELTLGVHWRAYSRTRGRLTWATFAHAAADKLRARARERGERFVATAWAVAEAARQLAELERADYLRDVAEGYKRAQTDYHPSVGRTIRAYTYRRGARVALRLEVPVRLRHGWGFAVLAVPFVNVRTDTVSAAFAVFGLDVDACAYQLIDDGKAPAGWRPMPGIGALVEQHAAQGEIIRGFFIDQKPA